MKHFFERSDVIAALHRIVGKTITPIMDVRDIPETLKYRPTRGLEVPLVRFRQLKKSLSAMQFISSLPKEPMYIIYVGSSRATNLGIVSHMFPHIKWLLFDPKEHVITRRGTSKFRKDFVYLSLSQEDTRLKNVNYWDGTSVRIISKCTKVPKLVPTVETINFIQESKYSFYITEETFTDELARYFATLNERGNVYFISNIRTRKHEDFTDMELLKNLAQQAIWCKILTPKKYMLRFRCPFYDNYSLKMCRQGKPEYSDIFTHAKKLLGIDFIGDYVSKKMVYLNSEHMWIPPYDEYTSTDCMLVGSGLSLREYDIIDYEDRFFWYNRIARTHGFHAHNLDHSLARELGIDHCADCAIMCRVLSDLGEVNRSLCTFLKTMKYSLYIPSNSHGQIWNPHKSIEEIFASQEIFSAVRYSRNFKFIQPELVLPSKKLIQRVNFIKEHSPHLVPLLVNFNLEIAPHAVQKDYRILLPDKKYLDLDIGRRKDYKDTIETWTVSYSKSDAIIRRVIAECGTSDYEIVDYANNAITSGRIMSYDALLNTRGEIVDLSKIKDDSLVFVNILSPILFNSVIYWLKEYKIKARGITLSQNRSIIDPRYDVEEYGDLLYVY